MKNHPWATAWTNQLKLAAAKKEYRRRKHNARSVELYDDFSKAIRHDRYERNKAEAQ